MADNFQTFFAAPFTDRRAPYDYQKCLACGQELDGKSREEWLDHGPQAVETASAPKNYSPALRKPSL